MNPVARISMLIASGLSLTVAQALGQPVGGVEERQSLQSAARPKAVVAELDFMLQAWSESAEQLAVARLALERSRDVRVRQFATALVRDHTAANLRLQKLAALRGLGIPAVVRQGHAAHYPRLQALRDFAFDRQFVAQVLRSHKQALALYRTEAASGKDETLVRFASDEIPKLRKHVARAEALRAQFEMRRRNFTPAR
jgi:putative membrane protein